MSDSEDEGGKYIFNSIQIQFKSYLPIQSYNDLSYLYT